MIKAIVMKPTDNVATVMEEALPGTKIALTVGSEKKTVTISEKIAFAHKFALENILKGSAIKKYGEVIGIATQDIKAGQHVHVHNIESTRGRGDKE